MDRRQALGLFARFALCPLCVSAAFGEENHAGTHWSYEGATGPDKWGSLDAENGMCSTGTQQSPIDLTEPINARQPVLEVFWSKRPQTIVNNGHTIQLNLTDGGSLKIGDRSYGLTQFHFHHPSEHLVHGKAFAMEAHFVHTAADGSLAVIGVLLAPGRANTVFHKIVSTMPAEEGPPVPADPAIDPKGLLPTQRSYYHYQGSLTTPPCSETVDWLVCNKPVEVAAADIARFAKLYPTNARPVQKPNRRFLLISEG